MLFKGSRLALSIRSILRDNARLPLNPARSTSPAYRSTYSTPRAFSVMSVVDITSKLQSLNIVPHGALVSHLPTNSPASWREELSKAKHLPSAPYRLVKTLVFKPKTAKSAIPIPVIVIADEETETNSSALGKRLNLKDLRLASADILQEFFGVDKDARERSPFL